MPRTVSLCMENDTPIIVFDLNEPENITRVAAGEAVGTLITGGQPCMKAARRWSATEHKMIRAVEVLGSRPAKRRSAPAERRRR